MLFAMKNYYFLVVNRAAVQGGANAISAQG
jgi:hypothetical protein